MHTQEGTADETGLNLTMQKEFCSICIAYYADICIFLVTHLYWEKK